MKSPPMLMPKVSLRLLSAMGFAFCAFTLAWVLWGFLTPGDYFANGSSLVWPSLIVAVVFGGMAGYRMPGWRRKVLLCVAVVCLCFWLFVRDGWWAKGL